MDKTQQVGEAQGIHERKVAYPQVKGKAFSEEQCLGDAANKKSGEGKIPQDIKSMPEREVNTSEGAKAMMWVMFRNRRRKQCLQMNSNHDAEPVDYAPSIFL